MQFKRNQEYVAKSFKNEEFSQLELSKEAQEKLGDYTILELIKSDEKTGELG